MAASRSCVIGYSFLANPVTCGRAASGADYNLQPPRAVLLISIIRAGYRLW